jgi:cytochrome b561
MPIRNSAERWGAVSQLLHWLVVALVVTQFVLANIAADLPLGSEKLATLARHKSIGITILALALLRLAWRYTGPTPSLPTNLAPWERTLARLSHVGLYALLLLVPLAGWIMSSARNFPVAWFNVVQLPDLVGPSQAIYEAAHETHEMLATTLGVLALVHAAAALRHHFRLRDDVLLRMLPFTRPRR